jgi:hypothetical protein
MQGGARAVWAALALCLPLGATAAAQDLLRTSVGDLSVGRGLGQVLRPAGDVDGDGVVDLVAAYRSGSTALPAGVGVAQVLSGRTGAALWTFTGAAAGDAFGRSLAAAGDVDGDGHADLLVGVPGADGAALDAGQARVLSGRDGAALLVLEGPFARARFGWDVAGLGDVDGDGVADLAVSGQPDPSAERPAGFVRVHSGADGGLLYELVGASAVSRLGCAIAAAGDVDGDGVPDLVVGDWRDPTAGVAAGAVHVAAGGSGELLWSFFGDAPQDQLGHRVDGAGDLDGDGRADVVASSPFADGAQRDVGLVRAWSGADGGVLLSRHGDFPLDFFGASVAGVGDVTGDGRDDLLVGAFADDDGATDAGRARVLSGADGSVAMELDGDSAGDELGFALCGLGDVDGDGGLDFAVAATADDAGGGRLSGSVRVYAGVPGAPTGPRSYCVASTSSSGGGARMGWSGSTSAGASDGVLRTSGAQPRSIGLYLASPEAAQLPVRGGVLCLGAPVTRLTPAVRIGPDGSAERALAPSRRGRRSVPVAPGATWRFQLLYVERGRRGGCALAFSDGLEVTFTP